MWSNTPARSTDSSTSPSNSGPSFPVSLISPNVSSALPEGYTIRPLQRTDYKAGFLDVLRVLTTVGDVSEQQWEDRYDERSRIPDTYFTLVVCDGAGQIVGIGTMVKESKLSANGSGVSLRHGC